MSEARALLLNGKYKVLSSGAILGVSGRPMRPQIDAKGYLRVQIKTPSKANGVTTLKIHRVVAEHFIPNPSNLPQVDHLDSDKANNDVSNLEWVSNDENQRRAVERGAYDHRLPDNIVKVGGQILTAILDGYVAQDLFEKNGVQRKTFWSAVEKGRIKEEDITTIALGRKKKYYYYDASRGKWRVERSDCMGGKQFSTEGEAIEYAKQGIGGGFFANRELARTAGRIGGLKSRRKGIKNVANS